MSFQRLLAVALLLIAIVARDVSAGSCLGPGVASIVVDRSSGAILIATRNGFLFRSTDGERWTRSNLPSRDVCLVDLDPGRPSTLWALAKDGMFKSADDGKSWSRSQDVQRPAVALAFHPVKPSILYAGLLGEMIKSADGGATWRTIFELPESLVTEIAVDPKNPDVVFAAVFADGNSRLMKTVDAGKTWKSIKEGKPVEELVIDSDAIYVVFRDQFAVSRDGGKSWQEIPVAGGMPTALTADPTRVGTLYAGSRGSGFDDPVALRVSTGGGKSWKEIYPFARGVDFVIRTKRLLLVSGNGRIFISSDDGRNFRRVAHEITSAAGLE